MNPIILSSLVVLSPLSAKLEIATVQIAPIKGFSTLAARIKLINRGPGNLKLWSPHNWEGMNCVRFSIQPSKGKAVAYKPLVPPRSAGVPTAVSLQPGQALTLMPIDFSTVRADARLPIGQYKVSVVYSNDLADSEPVTGVWTGTIQSKPVSVKL